MDIFGITLQFRQFISKMRVYIVGLIHNDDHIQLINMMTAMMLLRKNILYMLRICTSIYIYIFGIKCNFLTTVFTNKQKNPLSLKGMSMRLLGPSHFCSLPKQFSAISN